MIRTLPHFTFCHVICSYYSTTSAETPLVKHIQFLLESDNAFPCLTCIKCCRQYYMRIYSFNLVLRSKVLDRQRLFSCRNTPAALPSLLFTSVSASPTFSSSLPRYVNFVKLSNSFPSMLIGCVSVLSPLTRSIFVSCV